MDSLFVVFPQKKIVSGESCVDVDILVERKGGNYGGFKRLSPTKLGGAKFIFWTLNTLS